MTLKTLFDLTNPAPLRENYPNDEMWAQAHRNWMCQRNGWTYGQFARYCDKVRSFEES